MVRRKINYPDISSILIDDTKSLVHRNVRESLSTKRKLSLRYQESSPSVIVAANNFKS